MNVEFNHDKWILYNFYDVFFPYSKNNEENLKQFTIGKYGLTPKISEYHSYEVKNHKVFGPNTLLLGIGAEEVGVSISEVGCVSPIYNTFKISNIADSLYLKYLIPIIIQQNKFNITHTSTRRDYEIEITELRKIQFLLPPLETQRKISTLLLRIDSQITNQLMLVDVLKKLKLSLLNSMFADTLQSAPSVRFYGFTYPWEQRKLGQVGSVSMCRRIFKEQTSESGDIPFYKIGTFGGQADAYISSELFAEYRSKYPYPKEGDILISASGSIGRTVEFTGKNEYFQDSNIVWLNHDDRLDNSFLKCFYSVVKWAGIEGSTIKRLYNDNILNTVISMPSVAEQKKIGTFFKELDNLITLHQRESTYFTGGFYAEQHK